MSPFDPNPRPLEKSTYGFIWCHECDSVQPVEGHVCFTATTYRELLVKYVDRAEFAESVLCAMAFEHQRDLLAEQVAQVDPYAPIVCSCATCEASR